MAIERGSVCLCRSAAPSACYTGLMWASVIRVSSTNHRVGLQSLMESHTYLPLGYLRSTGHVPRGMYSAEPPVVFSGHQNHKFESRRAGRVRASKNG